MLSALSTQYDIGTIRSKGVSIMKKIIATLAILLTLSACSTQTETVPPAVSPGESLTSFSNDNVLTETPQGSQTTNYTLFINANLPTVIMAMGNNYKIEGYSIVYPFFDGNITFWAESLTNYDTFDPSTATGMTVYSITLRCSDRIKITNSELFTAMSMEEVSVWCEKKGYESNLSEYSEPENPAIEQTLYINCGETLIYYRWQNGVFSDVEISKNWDNFSDIDESATSEPQYYDPYANMTEFEYKRMAYVNGTPENNDVLRDITSYTEKAVMISGKVEYVSSLTDDDMSFLVTVNDYQGGYVVTCTSPNHIPIAVGDHIIVLGEITGLMPYFITNEYGVESTHDSYSVAVRYYSINQYTQTGVELTPEEKSFFFDHSYELTATGPYAEPVSEFYYEYYSTHPELAPINVHLTDTLINGYPYMVLDGSIERNLETGTVKMTIVYPSPAYYVSDFQRSIFLDLDGGISFSPGYKEDEYDYEHKPKRRDELQYYEGYIPFNPEDADVDESYLEAMPEEFLWVHYKKSD